MVRDPRRIFVELEERGRERTGGRLISCPQRWHALAAPVPQWLSASFCVHGLPWPTPSHTLSHGRGCGRRYLSRPPPLPPPLVPLPVVVAAARCLRGRRRLAPRHALAAARTHSRAWMLSSSSSLAAAIAVFRGHRLRLQSSRHGCHRSILVCVRPRSCSPPSSSSAEGSRRPIHAARISPPRRHLSCSPPLRPPLARSPCHRYRYAERFCCACAANQVAVVMYAAVANVRRGHYHCR